MEWCESRPPSCQTHQKRRWLQILTRGQAVSYTVLVNQTATHAVPAVLNSVGAALLRAVVGDTGAQLPVNNHPLPTLSGEAAIAVSRETGAPPPTKWC